eukprot:scaffold155738_cov22-Tisochrysis_lutea.AAC.3
MSAPRQARNPCAGAGCHRAQSVLISRMGVKEFQDVGLSETQANLLCNKFLSNAAAQSAAIEDTNIGLDSGWLVLCGALVGELAR